MLTLTLPYAVKTSRPRFLAVVAVKELAQSYEIDGLQPAKIRLATISMHLQ